MKGATAEIETIQSIIELHEYLLSSSFPNNACINMTIAYLQLCLASVSHGTDRNKAIGTAVTYLDANKEPSLEGDILRARIEAERGEYELAQRILAKGYEIMKECDDSMYVSINPVEYMLLPEKLRDVMSDFAYGPDCPTNVPVKLHILFLMAHYQSKLGMKESVAETRKEFKSQLKMEQMDKYDQELGKAMHNIIEHVEHHLPDNKTQTAD